MRPYILAETNWKHLRNEKIELAVLPWGATEAHNYHLPYSADVIEADHFCAEAAKRAYEQGAKCIVLPTVPYGVNTGQTDIRLDMSINPSTQAMIVRDLITVLDRQGIRKLLIVNSHGGNDFKPILRELGVTFPQMFLSYCNWYTSVKKTDFFANDGDHADEMETSLLMHLTPELVLPLDMAGDGKEKKIRIKSLQEGWAWTERKWSLVTDDTGIGDPRAATPEKGQTYFDAVVAKLTTLFVELSQADLNDLYE